MRGVVIDSVSSCVDMILFRHAKMSMAYSVLKDISDLSMNLTES
jgi:hypothetical protein